MLLGQLIENSVRLYPNRIALKYEKQELSYSELGGLANHLADTLKNEKNIREGDYIGICFDRSIEMIVGMLAILKSGAIFVPLKPDLPQQRIRFICEDIQLKLVIGAADYKKLFPPIIYHTYQHCNAFQTERASIHQISEDSGAVVLFTSGSTGNPKGVLLSHKSLVNRIVWDGEMYKHCSEDVVLQHASINFDFALYEIFIALGFGGKLVLARNDFHYDSSYLIDLIQQEKITKFGSVPSLIKGFIHLPEFKKCISLKQVFLGGETLHTSLQEEFFRNCDAELINIYGPTEASISVLNWSCQRNSELNIVPIGYEVAGNSIYLLDADFKEVEEGSDGELFICGPGVGLGYINRPALNKEKFFDDIKGSEFRMYRTGDIGRKLNNGAIQFIGRKDNQIKLRGLRVELDEIEVVLNSCELIHECAIHYIESERMDKKIIAYYVSNERDLDAFKKHLQHRLPSYMVPSIFVKMDTLPKSANGKIDKLQLPAPKDARTVSSEDYKKPQCEEHRKMVEIWEDILSISSIGIRDDFFSLGGDSLAFVELHQSLVEAFDYKGSVLELYKANTIESQYNLIKTHEHEGDNPLVVKYSDGKKGAFLVVRHMYGNGTQSSELKSYVDKDYSYYCSSSIKFEEGCNIITISEYALKVAEAYYELHEHKKLIICGFSMGGIIALEVANILKQKGICIQKLIMLDAYHPEVIKTATDKILERNRRKFFGQFIKNGYLALKRTLVKTQLKYLINKINKVENISLVNDNMGALALEQNLNIAGEHVVSNYKGDVLFVIAVDEEDNRKDVFRLRRERNNEMWENNIDGELIRKELYCIHADLMRKPVVEEVAGIILEYADN